MLRILDPRRDRETLTRILVSLCERLRRGLARKACRGTTIGVKLPDEDFRTVTRGKTLASPVAEPQAILRGARDCLRPVPLDHKLRLLGSGFRHCRGLTREVRPQCPAAKQPNRLSTGKI